MAQTPVDIMLDLETLSNRPDAAIICIGAATFRAGGGFGSLFRRDIDAESAERAGGHIAASTVRWWMGQSDAARAWAGRDTVSLQTALTDFEAWLRQFPAVRIWGNGAAFDNVVLRGAYERCGRPAPWKFFHDRCYRTLKALRPDIPAVKPRVAHDAVEDALAQAQHAAQILAAMSQPAEPQQPPGRLAEWRDAIIHAWRGRA